MKNMALIVETWSIVHNAQLNHLFVLALVRKMIRAATVLALRWDCLSAVL